MKKIFLLMAVALITMTAQAQLKVDSCGKVKIASNMIAPNTNLVVGGNQNGTLSYNVGIYGSTTAMSGNSNIGVYGKVGTNNGNESGKYYGVLGIASPVYPSNGMNYGLCGMIGFNGNPYNNYGGAGLFATNYTYFLSNPINIQGVYAGYFYGDIKVSGNITANHFYTPSDIRLNENVASLSERGGKTSTLDNLLDMNVIEYNMKSRLRDELSDSIKQDEPEEVREAYEYLKKDEMKMCARRHFGIDAKELQKIYPDLVLEGQDGYLAVNYVELVPLLIRSIQELKAELDKVKETNNNARKAPQANAVSNPIANQARLYQNTPNPFTERTEIRFDLTGDARDAYIYIFDMTGKMQKQIPIEPSMQSVTINGYELQAGIYLYSLVIGGQEIDTKRMILSK